VLLIEDFTWDEDAEYHTEGKVDAYIGHTCGIYLGEIDFDHYCYDGYVTNGPKDCPAGG